MRRSRAILKTEDIFLPALCAEWRTKAHHRLFLFMRARNVLLTLLVLLGLFAYAVFRKWQEPQPRALLNRAPQRLYFYAYALCQMKCLQLTKQQLKMVLQSGVVNLGRSRRVKQPCPLYAVQAKAGNRYIRAFFEQCRNGTYLVTCYDLNKDTACNCTTERPPAK